MRLLPLALVALLAATLPPAARAADEPPPSRRSLAGHRFLVSHLVEDPFSVTSFGLNVAFGYGEALGAGLDLSTSPPTALPGSKWYGYGGLAEEFDLTVRLLEYLSIRAGLVASVVQGAGEGSALVVGTTVRANGILGLKGSLPVGEALRFSASGEVAYGPHLNILLLQGIQQGIANDSFSAADLFRDRNSLTATGTAAGAWAPLPWLGLMANLSYLHTRSVDLADTSQDGVAGSASAEFDALPLVPWLPVGTNVAYRRTGSLGDGGLALSEEWGWGFFYTGRPDLALGVEVDHRRGRLDTELRSIQTLAWVNFRYYW